MEAEKIDEIGKDFHLYYGLELFIKILVTDLLQNDKSFNILRYAVAI